MQSGTNFRILGTAFGPVGKQPKSLQKFFFLWIWLPPDIGARLDPDWIPTGSRLDPDWIPTGQKRCPKMQKLVPDWLGPDGIPTTTPAPIFPAQTHPCPYSLIFQKTLLRSFNPYKRNLPLKKDCYFTQKKLLFHAKKDSYFHQKKTLIFSSQTSSCVCLFYVKRKIGYHVKTFLPPILNSELFYYIYIYIYMNVYVNSCLPSSTLNFI